MLAGGKGKEWQFCPSYSENLVVGIIGSGAGPVSAISGHYHISMNFLLTRYEIKRKLCNSGEVKKRIESLTISCSFVYSRGKK